MTTLVHNRTTGLPADLQTASTPAAQGRRAFDGGKGLAAMLLAAIVSAMLVVADQLISTWVQGHLMVAWVAMWAVGFAALALLAGTVRRFSANVMASLDGWSARLAQRRADERLWLIAQHDHRVMADLQSAMSRDEDAVPEAVAVRVRRQPAISRPIPMPYL